MAKSQKKTTIIWLIICLVLVSFLAIFSPYLNNMASKILLNNGIVTRIDNLLVHFISVGQGDSVAVNLPDDKVMVIDTGPYSNSLCLNYLNEKVFNSLNTNKIDYLVLTHADADHIGGALSVLSNYEVGIIYMPVVEGSSQTYNNLIAYIEENNLNTTVDFKDLVIYGDDYTIEFFGPLNYTNTNNSCPMIKLTYGDVSFLFTGDIPISMETKFIEEYGDLLDSDVLKVGHHGSSSSTGEDFLQVVTPDYAVISCGLNNSYGHPTEAVLNRLEAVGAEILRTDLLGDILFVVDENYTLYELDGDYAIVAFEFEFVYFVIVVDAVLLFYLVVVIVTGRNTKKVKNNA